MKSIFGVPLLLAFAGCVHQPEVIPPASVDFDLPPQVWSSLRDEFIKEVQGCDAWLNAPAAGLDPKFVFHGGLLRELSGDLGAPATDVVVPLDDEARLQLLALMRDDTPVKVSAEEWADGGCATLNEAMPIFTVTVVFEKQEYRYTIDPIFGFVDVSIAGRSGFYSENRPLSDKFVELYGNLAHDSSISAIIADIRKKNGQPNKPPEAMAVERQPSNPSPPPAMPHL